MISAKENQLPSCIERDTVIAKLEYANLTIPFLTVVVREIDELAEEHRSIRTRLGSIDLHRHLDGNVDLYSCLLYTSPSPRDGLLSRMPSSA